MLDQNLLFLVIYIYYCICERKINLMALKGNNYKQEKMVNWTTFKLVIGWLSNIKFKLTNWANMPFQPM